ncbi:MAG: outer membrane protein assembly factor BamE [Novosphingobium sp.]|nr:outer membrane protein assembly factor BamE [Novosphingobium sp.]
MQVSGRLGRGAAAAAVLVALAACSSIRDHRGYLVDTALVESVQPGIDNQTSVERALGRPTFVSQFGQPTWYYVSVDTRQAAATAPKPYKETILRVTFDPRGNVARVDKAGMEHVVRLSPDKKHTPTLGRERSFLEDLFGNIGTVGTGPGGPGGGAAGGGGSGPNGS